MALMEKRLSEYFSVALMEDVVIKRFYEHGSFIQNEEAHIMANVLTALNSVDFRFILMYAPKNSVVSKSSRYCTIFQIKLKL